MRAFLYRPQSVFFRRALFQVHLWAGIVAGLYLVVVCATGAALVFRIDMQRAAHPALFTPRDGPSAHPATVLEQVRDAFPADEVSFVEAPSRLRPVYLAYLRRGNDFPAVLVDPFAVESIASGLEQVTEPEEASRLRALGRERARQFHWSTAASRTLEVYRSLVS